MRVGAAILDLLCGAGLYPPLRTMVIHVERTRSGIWGWLRRVIRELRLLVENRGRDLALPILIWGADRLSLAAGERLARVLGQCLSLVLPVWRSSRYDKRAAEYGMRVSRRALGRPHLVTPFREFVRARKILRGEVVPVGQEWSERNAELVEELRRKGIPFLLVTGHFSREASLGLCLPQVTPGRLCVVVASLPGEARQFGERWKRQNFGQILEIMKSFRLDVETVGSGELGSLKRMLRRLRERGTVVMVAADAPWQEGAEGGYVRAFGGSSARSFSTGSARMARMSQCPIAVCIPHFDENGGLVIEWGRVIQPPERDDKGADERITDMILDEIERGAFERPEQYLIDILR